MKQSIRLLPLILLGSISANADVLWTSDPDLDDNYLHSFYRLSDEPLPQPQSSVDVATTVQFGKVWKIHKPAGQKRGELAQTAPVNFPSNSYTPANNTKIYVGWRVTYNIAGAITPGMIMWQNKSNAGGIQNYPLIMFYNGKEIVLNAVNAGNVQRRLMTYPVSEGEWVTIVLGIKFSNDASLGYVEAWVDGVKQTLTGGNAAKQVTQRTFDSTGNYFKWGAYDEASKNFDINVYLDSMKVATTYAEAIPTIPKP